MFSLFVFNDTATTEIYTLSLHDALPICVKVAVIGAAGRMGREVCRAALETDGVELAGGAVEPGAPELGAEDRKSTRLNSSHANISYAVFCLKKTKINCYERSEYIQP